jgi:type VI secretion system secreted protein Hcp
VAGGGAAFAVASVPDGNGVIHACYQVPSVDSTVPVATLGNVRVIDPSAGQACTTTSSPLGAQNPVERPLDWNTAGPRGATGPQGLQGAQGRTGNTLSVLGETFRLSNGRTLTATNQPTIAPLAVSPTARPIGTLTLHVLGAPPTIEVLSWSFGATNSGAHSGGGGGGAGKVKFNEFTITKTTDKASPQLFKFCANGKHIPTVVLFVRKAGGGQSVTFTFTNVLISAYQTGGSGHSDTPVESVSLNFTKVEVKYEPAHQ